MPARLPDFLGIGTQKGGTTSLHRWLQEHSKIYLPECKEIHYFDLQYEKSINWYKDQFKHSTKEQYCGEITPFYLFHPETPKRIKDQVPNVKLMVLLRDPAERAISQMMHSKKRGYEDLEPLEALEAEDERMRSGKLESLQKHSYLNRSLYLEQLDRYEAIFQREQMLILKSEEFFTGSTEIWEKITSFLEIDADQQHKRITSANKGNYTSSKKINEIRTVLRKKLKHTANEVRSRYGFGWDWEQ